MGTNFYWIPSEQQHCETCACFGEPRDAERHIGKRSAAGLYCYDCKVTLCKGEVHSGTGSYDACPVCGKTMNPPDGRLRGPVAVELGFAEPETVRPTGVDGASSFTWGLAPGDVRMRCADAPVEAKIIRDEYGREMTGSEFLKMLEANCPIEFTSLIGLDFS